MKQLKCQNCGGVLEYDEGDVRVLGGGNVVIGGDVVGGNLIVTGSGNRIVRKW